MPRSHKKKANTPIMMSVAARSQIRNVSGSSDTTNSRLMWDSVQTQPAAPRSPIHMREITEISSIQKGLEFSTYLENTCQQINADRMIMMTAVAAVINLSVRSSQRMMRCPDTLVSLLREDAVAKTVPYQRKIWADYIGDAVKQLKAKGMVFNEVNNIKDFQALAKPIYKEFEPVVGADLIDAIVKHK